MVIPVIGILALQGAFARHVSVLKTINVDVYPIRYPGDLSKCNGLIIPGGESTTLSKLIDYIGIRDEIIKFADCFPILGTCAGMILMAKNVGDSRVDSLGLIDISVERNAYGRQVDSFVEKLLYRTNDSVETIKGVFIRAPRIKSVGEHVEVLAELNGEPVFVHDGLHLATSFHPELSGSSAIHDLFISIIKEPVFAK